jgi:hypothetical protein
MPVLNEIAAHIAATSTGFSAGPHPTKIQIFIGVFPEDQRATAIALYESGGAPPVYTYGSSPLVERPTVQVISRSSSYATARTNATTIYNILAAVEDATLSGTAYTRVTPLQSPLDMGNDADDRQLISCNYMTEKAVS